MPRSRTTPEPPPKPTLGRVLDFMRVLWALDHGLQSASKRMQAEYGVTGLQRMMIRVIGRFPGRAPTELAGVLHVHKSTLTGALARLEAAGAIVREVDPEDARRARLTLGPQGRAIDEVRNGTVEAAVRRALSQIPDEQLEAARAVLLAITRELDAQQ